jgi:hypothetical protein
VHGLLLQRVYIETEAQLMAFEHRLRDGDSGEHPIGGLVEHFFSPEIGSPNKPETFILDDGGLEAMLLSVLGRVPNLRIYTLKSVITSAKELQCLSQAAANLGRLNVTLFCHHVGTFLPIASFQRLQNLALSFNGDQWRHPITHALHMPTVRKFLWRSYNLGDSEDMLRFLCNCSFGIRLDITLHIPELSPALAHHLQPFLIKHACASIVIGVPAASTDLLFPNLVQADYLDLRKMTPLTELAGPATILPRKIVAWYVPVDHPEPPEFWAFMEALPASFSRQSPGTSVLNVWMQSENQVFKWPARSESHTPFIERLIPHACALYQQGILVTDRDGRDVTCLDATC